MARFPFWATLTLMMSKRTRSSLSRRNPKRHLKSRILLVCEGEKTEPNYFNELRRDRKLHGLRIVGEACGSHPSSVVEFAAQNQDDFDHIWCAFDRNNHIKIHEAIERARALNFRLAFSNPCFELWYLLHFEHQTAEVTRSQVQRKLKRHIADYHKAKIGMYEATRERIEVATRRAEELRTRNATACKKPTDNPSTGVALLVSFLLDLAESEGNGS